MILRVYTDRNQLWSEKVGSNMKCINHKDLCLLIPFVKDMPSWDLSNFEDLLEKFGDDWYAEGERWELVTENKRMKEIREYFEKHSNDQLQGGA